MKYWVYILLALVVLFDATGCRKKSDDIPPQLERTLPLSNSASLLFQDQLEFSYDASDNIELANYQAFLKNENGQIVWSIGGTIEGRSVAFSFFITHDDPHWESGVYLLSVQVEDADGNTASDFFNLQISGAPLELTATMIFIDDPGQTSTLHTLQEDGTFNQATTVDHDLHTVGVSSWNQLLVLGGDELPYLTFIGAEEYQVLNQYEGQNPLGGNFVTDVYEHPETHDQFVSTFDRQISRYGASGGLEFTFQIDPSFRPVQLAAWENLLIAVVDPINNNDQLLNLYYASSGVLYLSLTLDFTIEELMVWEDRLILLGNDDQNNPVLKVFDLESESLFNPGWLISGEVVSVAKHLEGNWFAIGHTDGVYLQNFAVNSFFDGSNNGLAAISLDFDPTTGLVYVLTTNELSTVALSGGTVTETFSAPIGSKFVRLLFNK